MIAGRAVRITIERQSESMSILVDGNWLQCQGQEAAARGGWRRDRTTLCINRRDTAMPWTDTAISCSCIDLQNTSGSAPWESNRKDGNVHYWQMTSKYNYKMYLQFRYPP